MAIYQARPPFEIFFDTDGSPLENGSIWIGEQDQNPVTHPLPITWDLNGLYPAAQPIRTINGYAVNNGSPSNFFIFTNNFNYSILIKNKNDEIVFNSSRGESFVSLYFAATESQARAANGPVVFIADITLTSNWTPDYPINTNGFQIDGAFTLDFSNAQPILYPNCFGSSITVTNLNQAIPDYWGINTTAFNKAISAVVTGGKIDLLPNTTYIYTNVWNLTKGVDIDGHGSILKAQDALVRDISGDPWDGVLGAIKAINISHLKIYNLKIDGNRSTRSPAVPSLSHNLALYGCDNFLIENVISYNSVADNLYVGYSDAGSDTRSYDGVICGGDYYNGFRNNISITGATDITIENLIARDANGTGPEYGIDIEGDSVINQNEGIVVKRVLLSGNAGKGAAIARYSVNCKILHSRAINNGGTTRVVQCWGLADQEGSTNGSYGHEISNCIVSGTIKGGAVAFGGILSRSDGTKINYNQIDNTGDGIGTCYGIYQDVSAAIDQEAIYNRLTYTTTKPQYGIYTISIGSKIIGNTIDEVLTGGIISTGANMNISMNRISGIEGASNWHLSVTGNYSTVTDNQLIYSAGGTPAKGLLGNSTAGIFANNIAVGCGTTAAGFMMDFSARGWSKIAGNYDAGAATALSQANFQWEGESGKYNLRMSAAPGVGPWQVGDRFTYVTPSAGGNIGEVCTTGGTPGTWKTWGSIAP